jgi:hypothetical protein
LPVHGSATRAGGRLWIPVAVAVLTQALLFVSLEPEIAFDSASYMTQAESLASTGAANNARGEPDTVRTPGYPAFLAVFLAAGLGYPGAIAAQHLLWILVVSATTFLTFRITGSIVAANVAGLITAIDVPALQATHSVLTETWATVFVALAAWQAYRAAKTGDTANAILAGLLAGFAALIRPVAILLGVPLAVAIVIAGSREVRVRVAAIILIASLPIPAIWIARNYLRTGVATFSSIGSINMLLYRAAGTLAIRDPGGVDANITRRQAELEAAACGAAALRFKRDCDSIPIAQRATLYTDLAMPILLADPVAVVMQAGRAFVMIMFGGGANLISGVTGIDESRARLLALAYTAPLAILACAGIIYWRRIDRVASWLMVLTIAYLVVMSLGVEAYSRFRVPFLPLYAMLAGGGAAMLFGRARINA